MLGSTRPPYFSFQLREHTYIQLRNTCAAFTGHCILSSQGRLLQVCECSWRRFRLDIGPRLGYVRASSQTTHVSSHLYLAPLAEILLCRLHISSLLKTFPAQFRWLWHLITFLIISYISLHPSPAGTGFVVFRCKPVACLSLHLFKIPGRPSASAKLGQLFPAVYIHYNFHFGKRLHCISHLVTRLLIMYFL